MKECPIRPSVLGDDAWAILLSRYRCMASSTNCSAALTKLKWRSEEGAAGQSHSEGGI